jgi:hypothetical protein
MNQAFMVELLQRSHYQRTPIRLVLVKKHEHGGNLSIGLMSPNLLFLVPTAMSL